MNFLRTVAAVIMTGAFLTSCDSVQVRGSGAVVTPTGSTARDWYPPGFDPSAYRPPDHWQEACKKAYDMFAVPLLTGWNATRILLERSGDPSINSGMLSVTYEVVAESSQQEILRACKQADPVVGAQFERGVEALGAVVDIVCEGSSCGSRELTPDEQATLEKSISPMLAAVPPKR